MMQSVEFETGHFTYYMVIGSLIVTLQGSSSEYLLNYILHILDF